MSKFVTVPISQLGKTVTGKTPSSESPADFGGETPFVTPSDSFDQKYIDRTERYLSAEGVENLIGKLLPTESVMVTCIGSAMGKVAMNRVPSITNQQINSVIVSEKYSSRYIYYTLSNNYKLLRNAATGSTALPLLNKTDFELLSFQIHSDKSDQQKIAAALSALDAKIDCNNRINAELEAMAKTLYDYWFVQFDFPFDFAQGKPDANGKPYKSSGGKMVYNATLKREIPAGWEVLNLSDFVDLIKGNVSPADVSENTPYIGLEHIGRKTIALANWANSDLAASDKTVFKKNDILFGKIRPYFHKVAVAPFDGITSTDTIILRPKKKIFSGLALESVFADEFVEAATQSSTGSKMPRADWNVLQNYKIPGPTMDLLHVFNAVYEKALEKIQLSGLENKKLAELRDWLLPLLMNGQVTVA